MILSDAEIHDYCRSGTTISSLPLVEPYIPQNVQPASIDVRLGNHFLVPRYGDTAVIDLGDPRTFQDLTEERQIDDGAPLVIRPHRCVLGATKEWVNIPADLKCSIEGKSSVGRLFLFVHVTAGYIDPGFKGNVTIEMFNANDIPIIVRPDCLIAQLAFHRMSKPAEKPYQGRYQCDEGAAPSRYGAMMGPDREVKQNYLEHVWGDRIRLGQALKDGEAGELEKPSAIGKQIRSSRRDTLEAAADSVAERISKSPGSSRTATGHILRHDRGMG